MYHVNFLIIIIAGMYAPPKCLKYILGRGWHVYLVMLGVCMWQSLQAIQDLPKTVVLVTKPPSRASGIIKSFSTSLKIHDRLMCDNHFFLFTTANR